MRKKRKGHGDVEDNLRIGINIQRKHENVPILATPSSIEERQLLSVGTFHVGQNFYGRKEIIDKIRYMFEKENQHVVFLHGIGGIGKTEIAKQYVRAYRDSYKTIIYLLYEENLERMVIDQSRFCLKPELTRYENENDADFYERKIAEILGCSDEKVLIIIDNFDVRNDTGLRRLVGGRYHLLLTSRCDYSREYPTIYVDAIESMEELKNIFFANYGYGDIPRDDENLERLIRMVKGHTYTIQLIARHMEVSGQNTEQLIRILETEGVTSLRMDLDCDQMTDDSVRTLLMKMFKALELEEAQQQVLRCLSLMPMDGVGKQELKDWMGLSDNMALDSLVKTGWIMINDGLISLHPVVKDVIKQALPATPENCSVFVETFSKTTVENVWHWEKKKKDYYGRVAKSVISNFSEITPATEKLYYNTQVLLSFSVDVETSKMLSEKLYDYYEKCCGHFSFEVGRSAFKRGWLYAYNTHLENSIENAIFWLSRADEIFMQILDTLDDEKASVWCQTKVNLAKVFLRKSKGEKNEDYEKSLTYAQQATQYARDSISSESGQYAKVAGAYWQLAEVLLVGGEIDSARENIEKSLEILNNIHQNQINCDTLHASGQKAAILLAQGEFVEARNLARESAEGYARYFGKENAIVVDLYCLYADCCVAVNDWKEAYEVYGETLKIAEKLYAPESEKIKVIRDKMNRTQQI